MIAESLNKFEHLVSSQRENGDQISKIVKRMAKINVRHLNLLARISYFLPSMVTEEGLSSNFVTISSQKHKK